MMLPMVTEIEFCEHIEDDGFPIRLSRMSFERNRSVDILFYFEPVCYDRTRSIE